MRFQFVRAQVARRQVARQWLALVMLALTTTLLAAGVAPPSPAVAQEASGPTASSRAEFPVELAFTGPGEAVQMVVDFPAGSRVARHTHGGPGYITMLQNELTMWIGDAPVRTYTKAESFVEPFRLVAEGANLGAEPSSVLVTYLIPVGAPVTTLEANGTPTSPASGSGQLPPGASPRFESRLRIESSANVHKLTQALRHYEPGSKTWSVVPKSTLALLTVVEGEVTVVTGAGERVYRAGEHWTEVVGEGVLSYNAGSAPATAAISVLHLN